MQIEYSPGSGAAVTDEVVKTSRSIGGGLYTGFLCELADVQFLESDDPDYGAWTAASKGGTRWTLIEDGTPGANEAKVDRQTGLVTTATQDQILYFRYVGFGPPPFARYARSLTLHLPNVVDASAGNVDIFDNLEFEHGAAFVAGQVVWQSGPSGAAQVLRFQKTSGETTTATAETLATADVSTSDAAAMSGYGVFTGRLKFHPGEHLRISGQSASAGLPTGPTIQLLER